MEYNNIYQIKYNSKVFLVSAKSSTSAIEAWVDNLNNERVKDNFKPRKAPDSFEIIMLDREDFIIRASD